MLKSYMTETDSVQLCSLSRQRILPSMAFFFSFGLTFFCNGAGNFLPLPLCTDCSQNTYKKRT